MTGIEWGVLLAGIAAIAWVNWYFFRAEGRSARASAGASGVQEVVIIVRGGYDPATIRVHHGRPVRLIFDRRERDGCSDEIVIGALGVRRFLPPFQRTAVDVLPEKRGSYEFTCGMGMLHGTLVVE